MKALLWMDTNIVTFLLLAIVTLCSNETAVSEVLVITTE